MGISIRGEGECFCVGAASLTGEPNGFPYGINRGKEGRKDAWTPRDQELAGILAKDGYRSEPWWVGWRYFSQAGVPSLDIHQMNRDNRGEGEVAKQVAEHIWNPFEEHRTILEELNQNYPYKRA